jgi:hypothetical protein
MLWESGSGKEVMKTVLATTFSGNKMMKKVLATTLL